MTTESDRLHAFEERVEARRARLRAAALLAAEIERLDRRALLAQQPQPEGDEHV